MRTASDPKRRLPLKQLAVNLPTDFQVQAVRTKRPAVGLRQSNNLFQTISMGYNGFYTESLINLRTAELEEG
jgi:hypothetical protein